MAKETVKKKKVDGKEKKVVELPKEIPLHELNKLAYKSALARKEE